MPVLEFIDAFLQHVLPCGKRHVLAYWYFAPGKRARVFGCSPSSLVSAVEQDDDPPQSGDEPTRSDEPATDDHCPCCARRDGMRERLPTPHRARNHAAAAARSPSATTPLHVT